MYRLLGPIVLAFVLLPTSASADQGVVFRLCNSDKERDIHVAMSNWNWGWGTVSVVGWYTVGKNSCRNLNAHTGFYWRHYFVFQRGGELLPFTPSESKIGPFTFTGATWPTKQKFCVDLKDSFAIKETIFDLDRSVKCRGSETLVQFNYVINGVDSNGPYQEYVVTLPAVELPGERKTVAAPPVRNDGTPTTRPASQARSQAGRDLFNKPWFDAAGFMRDLVSTAAPLRDTYPITQDATIEAARMYWHDKAFVVRVQAPSWQKPNLYLYFLTDGERTVWLDGTVSPINAFVADKPLQLSPLAAAEYLRFFTFFVRAEEGPFLVVESAGDRFLPAESSRASAADVEKMAAMRKLLREAECRVESDAADCTAVIYYSNAVFEASLRIKPNGRVEMLNDKPVTADLPLIVDAPLR